ncbi:fimbrial assembly protein [Burkholderia territorii]|uniref:CS1 type fimbrial major subunit n=1 Tax=Burkholderia territorii TaxID=1503055 RepID=UPI000751DF7B|nr:CS1 type fimbrial major subunit [Burkholderia territorii]KWH08465.1 fimbrial assembly protein [Burkholderia territorii]
MKLCKLVVALGISGVLVGSAFAADPVETEVTKKITLTAQINDGIFVSKPDGSSWYSSEELDAEDYKQMKFSKKLPIRLWSKNPDVNVSLAQPLKMSNGRYEMLNPKVTLTAEGGDAELKFGQVHKLTQTTQGNGGYDEIHNVVINVDAPTAGKQGATNGSYSGDLVMLFEPVASSGGGGNGGGGEEGGKPSA